MDALEGQFGGYTSGHTWNGWACPCFQRASAEQILRASEANGYRWSYDLERDAFIIGNIDDPDHTEPEEIEATTIYIDGNEVKVYPVGTNSRIWEECD